MLRNLQLNISATCAHENCWPYIDIIINNKILYSNFLNEQNLINIKFKSLKKNFIAIHYKNKRNGPDTWDTILDDQGNIIKDQHIIVQGIKIDECNLNFLIKIIKFETLAGDLIDCNGFIGHNGFYGIKYNEPYYDWVYSTRLQFINKVETDKFDSSLPFVTNYVYHHDNEVITKLLEKFQKAVDATKDISSDDSLP